MDTDDIWNELFGGGFGSMAKRMEKMFSELENLRGADVRTYGYTMYQDSDGNRHVREFGDPAAERNTPSIAAEPFTDVSLEGDLVRVVVDVPGISKEDIVLKVADDSLSITVDTERREFSRTLALPCRVEPGSAAMEYNNGILEVTLASADAPASSDP